MATTGDIHMAAMRRAIELSRVHMHANEGGPFGAVIARGGEIVAEGWNCVLATKDPTAHAEVVAIRNATAKLGNYSLKGHDLYTSCEPCPMCLAAAYWARVDRLFYANSRSDAASIGFDDALIYTEIPLPLEQRQLPTTRLLPDEAAAVFQEWLAKPDHKVY
jgi:tRNA(Arg) A34 adenosine deaminase TadA